MTSCNLLAPSLGLYVSLINSGKKKMFGVYDFCYLRCCINQTHIIHVLFSHDGSLISVSCLCSLFWQVSDGLSGREGRDDDYTGMHTSHTLPSPQWSPFSWWGWHLADRDITLDNYWWQWITLTAALAPAHTGATLRYSEIKTQDALPGHWTGVEWSVPPVAPAPTPAQRPTPAPDTFSRRG